MRLTVLFENTWIGVDLDGTLAKDDGFRGLDHVGDPIPLMVRRVKKWLADGRTVKILTARAQDKEAIAPIKAWCKEHLGRELEVTNEKDPAMTELWDDKAVAVRKNTGEIIGDDDGIPD